MFHPPPWLHPNITMTNPTWRTRINTDHPNTDHPNTDYRGPPDTS